MIDTELYINDSVIYIMQAYMYTVGRALFAQVHACVLAGTHFFKHSFSQSRNLQATHLKPVLQYRAIHVMLGGKSSGW